MNRLEAIGRLEENTGAKPVKKVKERLRRAFDGKNG
jgi:hypothetical protein